MNAATASLLNGFLLIALSMWGYYASTSPSPTALIPTLVGAVLLLCYPGVKKHNKLIAHIAVALTLLVLIALVMPMRGAIGRGDGAAIARVGIMWGSTAYALFYFIKSFIDARKDKA
ncbi:MAG: hypothetical protein AAGJ09_04365 [Pseudomonadota bacterium]